MKKLCASFCVLMFLAGSAVALEIQVAPQTLVLSSSGGQLTVHTDVPFAMAEAVSLEVDGTVIEVNTFADNCGNLVAQCSKDAAADAIGDFEGNTTTVTVTLTVDGDSASEDIRVKK